MTTKPQKCKDLNLNISQFNTRIYKVGRDSQAAWIQQLLFAFFPEQIKRTLLAVVVWWCDFWRKRHRCNPLSSKRCERNKFLEVCKPQMLLDWPFWLWRNRVTGKGLILPLCKLRPNPCIPRRTCDPFKETTKCVFSLIMLL